MPGNIKNVMAAINYIESHLHEKLDLETVAKAVHYSKYHLHRMFTGMVGLTIHDYVQRRQLTEAAKLLVLSDRPILEIALSAGYESQQSFTDIFKAMYKKSPNQYRAEQEFYPLQLRYVLNENLVNLEEKEWQDKIVFATQEDIPKWIELVHLVIDGFPHLDEKQYLEQLQEYINNKQALILKDSDTAIGIMVFHEVTGSIDFFGVHPQYRKREVAKAFCEKALYELACSAQISVTTFRKGDKADTGYREIWGSLGSPLVGIFAETGLIKWEAVSNNIISADFRTDYSAVAYIAECFGCNGCMDCSTDSRANYHDCSTGFSLSEQRKVSLLIKRRLSCHPAVLK